MAISEAQRQVVRQRAGQLCEYCHTAEQWQYVPFTVDHIIPISEDGTSTMDNLCLACFHCNRQKSNLVQAPDPESGEETALFHPRLHQWPKHFVWTSDGLRIIGLTPIGRATVASLHFNRERVIPIRAADVVVGRHPPEGDPVLQS